MIYTIQTNVPICPECGGGLKFRQIVEKYQCLHCGNSYKVLQIGQNEREMICEVEKNCKKC